jgi:hypothetical protein
MVVRFRYCRELDMGASERSDVVMIMIIIEYKRVDRSTNDLELDLGPRRGSRDHNKLIRRNSPGSQSVVNRT